MEVGILAPVPLLEDYCTLTHYHLCKPGLVLNSKYYLDFYLHRKSLGDFVILDCSDSEPRVAVSSDLLMEAVTQLKPSLVVAPDWEMNSVRTINQTLEFLDIYGKELRENGIQVLGMLQGATLDQVVFCYKGIHRAVDALGLPRSLEASVGRPTFFKKIRTKKPIHIFGIHSDLEKEVDQLLDLNGTRLVGITTDMPVRLGLVCRLLDEPRPEPSVLDFYDDNNPFPEFTLQNVKDFIEIAEGNL